MGRVLEAAVHATGDFGQVALPQHLLLGEIVLDEDVVACDVLAASVEGGAGVDDDGEAIEGVDADAAGVKFGVEAQAWDLDGLDFGRGRVPGSDTRVVEDTIRVSL